MVLSVRLLYNKGRRLWLRLKSLPSIVWVVMIALVMWSAFAQDAMASLHTYREQPGQVTVRSRLSLRDRNDRAWQAIAFKRLQGDQLQGIYIRLVGFPGAVQVDRQPPITVLAPTGQQWQLQGALDPQTQTLPLNVGQYDLQPLLRDVQTALPLEIQVALKEADPAEFAVAPFVVDEWLQVKGATASPAPVASSLGKES